MANIKTRALSEEQYHEIINTIEAGFLSSRPNPQIATILKLEANLGMRISDILRMTLNSIVYESGRYRLDVSEKKTNKERVFTVNTDVVEFIRSYAKANNIIDPNEELFKIQERAVQKHLKKVTDYLGYENISTHSFRKFFATSIYQDNNCDVVLVQNILQHSSPAVTQKYIGISEKKIESALSKHIKL